MTRNEIFRMAHEAGLKTPWDLMEYQWKFAALVAAAGRAGDPPAQSLSARLKELKLPQGRLKTGTPPRLDGRSIDYA